MAIEINTDTIAEAVVNRLRDSVVLTPRLLTLNQAAAYLGLTTDALKAKVHMGRIPTADLDKKLRFDKLDLDRIIDERKTLLSMRKVRKKRNTRGQGTLYDRNEIWWCDYSVDGVRKRESCETRDRDEALAYLHRKQGRLASGEKLTPDRVTVRDLLRLLLEDYEIRQVAQLYISTLKVKSILLPKVGDLKAAKLTSSRIKEYIESRLKVVKHGTINRELALLHRAFQLAYNQDPPLVARVPHFPKLTEDEPRKGFLKPESYQSSYSNCLRNFGFCLFSLIVLGCVRVRF